MVIPEHPQKKTPEENSEDKEMVRQTLFLTSVIQLPVILLTVIGTYFAVTEIEGFKQDWNIGCTLIKFPKQ